jgi:hypothetical protein
MVSEIIKKRFEKIDSLNEKEKIKYWKSEREFLYKKLGKIRINYHFGKGKRFISGINYNIEVLIYRDLKETIQVQETHYLNRFYKYVDEFCGCGKYNSTLFR